uniref:Uncharacterized protein n=1 Tax=Rhizophora mucronata TaxID=61149 RepID=A0A2P2NL87_RHIMU
MASTLFVIPLTLRYMIWLTCTAEVWFWQAIGESQ